MSRSLAGKRQRGRSAFQAEVLARAILEVKERYTFKELVLVG